MATQTENSSDTVSMVIEDDKKHLKSAAKRAYAGQKNLPDQNKQIAELLPMVHKIAQQVVTYLKPPLSHEDLVSAGTIGLVKAAHNYNSSYQAEFKTYAYIRIKGAILDELRGWSFVPASVTKKIRHALQISSEITEQTGSAPTNSELAEKLNIPVNKLYAMFENARAQNFISIDNTDEDSMALSNILAKTNVTTPPQQLEQNELIDKLTEAILQLDKRQRQIILLYYQQQLTMKQIAKLFNITEPRVSQLHANALFNLSVKLRQWKNGRE